MRKTGLVFLMRGGIAVFMLLFTALLTRSIGAEQSGNFFFALSVATIISTLARFGSDGAALASIAKFSAVGNWKSANEHYSNAILIGLIGGTIGAIFMVMLGYIEFGKWKVIPISTNLVTIFAATVLPMSIAGVLSEALRATGFVYGSTLSAGLLTYCLASLGLVVLLVSSNTQVSEYLSAGMFALSLVVNCMAAGYLVGRHRVLRVVRPKDITCFAQYCRPFWLSSLATRAITPHAPVLFTMYVATTADVAQFAAATRVSLSLALLLAVANIITSKEISTNHYREKHSLLKQAVQKASFAVNAIALPLAAGIYIYSSEIMSIFGSEFVAGGRILELLVLAQATSCAAGPVGNVLTMTGNQKAFWHSALLGTIVLICVAPVLSMKMGAVGSAYAVLFGAIAQNGFALYAVKKKLGFWLLPIPIGSTRFS